VGKRCRHEGLKKNRLRLAPRDQHLVEVFNTNVNKVVEITRLRKLSCSQQEASTFCTELSASLRYELAENAKRRETSPPC